MWSTDILNNNKSIVTNIIYISDKQQTYIAMIVISFKLYTNWRVEFQKQLRPRGSYNIVASAAARKWTVV